MIYLNENVYIVLYVFAMSILNLVYVIEWIVAVNKMIQGNLVKHIDWTNVVTDRLLHESGT